MKIHGADEVVRALEDEGVRFTFGIPGTHNIELYDALDRSEAIEAILVTDEQSASFMADGVSRTSDRIGVVNVVPGAGVTHSLSGIAEALLDNVPMVVLACGIRTDSKKAYQLHDIDQRSLLEPVTKATLRPDRAGAIYSTVRQAFDLARRGTPGPVAVEIPANYYMIMQDGEAGVLSGQGQSTKPATASDSFDAAAQLITESRFPTLYVGNGASGAAPLVRELAEKLRAPVATTIQGKGVFPETHPLWLWNGFGPSAPMFVQKIMRRCDCLIAIGCRFSEVGTAAYGMTPPPNLIHVDINAEVFNRNYPAKISIESDSGQFLEQILPRLTRRERGMKLEAEIAQGQDKVKIDWQSSLSSDKVTPALFFEAIRSSAGPRTIFATDSGNGTFLAMEHLRLEEPRCFIGPVDYSCMGYSVPAAIGAKLANPERDVVALAGDGALLMTGLELLTAANYGIAPVVCVLRDGELSQIAQFQRTSLNRDTCSILPPFSVEVFSRMVNCGYKKVSADGDLSSEIPQAVEMARGGRPVVVEVDIDYTQKTYFTKGVISTILWRLPWQERLRMLARAAGRHLRRAERSQPFRNHPPRQEPSSHRG